MRDSEAGLSRKGWVLLVGGMSALGLLAGAAIKETHQSPDNSSVPSASSSSETGMASCDAIDVTVVDSQRHIIEVATKFHLTGSARFAEITYIFDEHENSITATGDQPFLHDYPDEPANQRHHVSAIIDYWRDGKEFGGLPVCETDVQF